MSVLHSFLLPSDIPLYGHTTFCISVHQSVYIGVVSTVRLVNNADFKVQVHVLCGHRFSVLLGLNLEVESVGGKVTVFVRIGQTIFQSGCTILQSHQQLIFK